MRPTQSQVGPRGLVLLAVTGLAGLGLAVHGWSSRGSAPVSSAIGVNSRPSTTHSAGPSPAATTSASPTPSTTSTSSGQGPLLTSQPFAPYAYLVWPGTPSSAARAAEAGLSISVRRNASGILVSVSVNGQSTGSPHSYAGGAKVYVVEAAIGDDSGNSDYNLGDDGLVVTDAAGRIVQ